MISVYPVLPCDDVISPTTEYPKLEAVVLLGLVNAKPGTVVVVAEKLNLPPVGDFLYHRAFSNH